MTLDPLIASGICCARFCYGLRCVLPLITDIVVTLLRLLTLFVGGTLPTLYRRLPVVYCYCGIVCHWVLLYDY